MNLLGTQYKNRALMTDYYELTMAQGYFDNETINNTATFELFYRSNPFEGGYGIATGISDAIQFINNFKFNDDDISYLKSQNDFSEEFLNYLRKIEFKGEVIGVPDGTIVFPYEPIMEVTGPLGVVQLLESELLNIINYQTLVATKASRIVLASKRDNTILEFGLRRGHGDGAIVGAKAAIIGGCVGTSNTIAGKFYNVPVSGTQAHSWIQSFETEIEAFRAYARTFPNNTILLVDTYDTLEGGIPNAIEVAKEMEQRGEKLKGIRIDSGDLAWLSVKAAKMLDEADLEYVKIVLSGDLDEFVIESIVNQIRNGISSDLSKEFKNRLIDRLLWGVGTNLITGSGGEQAALGGVYKLVEIDEEPVIKISENRAKTTNPGRKKLWRISKPEGNWIGDVMGKFDEDKPKIGDKIYHHSDASKSLVLGECEVNNLHVDLLEKYSSVDEKEIWEESRNRVRDQINNKIDKSHLRFLNPHIYKISLTEKLFNLKQDFLEKHSE